MQRRHKIARAVKQFILRNEIAHTRRGLESLVAWLREIADDFEAHGADVSDIRAVIQHFKDEIRHRRGGMTLRTVMLAAATSLLAACGPDRSQQLANCRIVGATGQAVTDCLILKYDWDGTDALIAGLQVQAARDSAQISRLEHRADSDRVAQAERSRRSIAAARPWVDCVLVERGKKRLFPDVVATCRRLRPSSDALTIYLAAVRDTALFPGEEEYLRLVYRPTP